MDVKTCIALGIDYVKARDSEFGTYRVPGHDFVPYFGVSEPVEIKFDDQCSIRVPEFKLIECSYPLVLVGADALRPGWFN